MYRAALTSCQLSVCGGRTGNVLERGEECKYANVVEAKWCGVVERGW